MRRVGLGDGVAHLDFGLASSFFWSLLAAGSGGAFSSSSGASFTVVSITLTLALSSRPTPPTMTTSSPGRTPFKICTLSDRKSRRVLFRSVFVRGFLHRGVDHLDLGLVVQADAAHDDHLFAGADAVQDLHLVALAHAQFHGPAVGDVVRGDHQAGRAAPAKRWSS